MGEEDDEFHALQFLQMDCVLASVFVAGYYMLDVQSAVKNWSAPCPHAAAGAPVFFHV